MKPLIHFAHGNGFPSRCYNQLFLALSEQFDICYLDKIGHDPRFPVTDNWYNLVNELINSVTSQAQQPVIAVGHSMGGVLSLLAAIERPDLFKAVIMIDAPLLGHWRSYAVRLAKWLGVIDRITPAHRTRGRRKHWQDKDELLHYLKTRPLFKSFTPACLEDYIEYGLKKDEEGYHLAFDPQIEYRIFRTIPHNLPQFAGQLTVPTTLIYADKSDVMGRYDVRFMKLHYGIHCVKVKGTHMLPMEDPQGLAEHIFMSLNGI